MVAGMRTAATLGIVVFFTACAAPSSRDSLAVWVEPVTGMEFLKVPPGRFSMGSGAEVVGRQDDERVHEVELTQGFYLGRDEVTQEQWIEVMNYNPSQFPECGQRCPIETVSFLDIQVFIRELEKRSRNARFRLPTEAEWEYACRAGTDTPFWTGNTIGADQANIDGKYPYIGVPPGVFLGSPAPVGSYPANPWGFRDMHGNVWEWCQDWYGQYPDGRVVNPRGPEVGELRVIRGGSWVFDANSARSALRYTHAPEDSGYSLGFRLVAATVP